MGGEVIYTQADIVFDEGRARGCEELLDKLVKDNKITMEEAEQYKRPLLIEISEKRPDRVLVARKKGEAGCTAYATTTGKTTSTLIKYLELKTKGTEVEILSITDKDIYREYAPYNMVDTELEFITKVLEM